MTETKISTPTSKHHLWAAVLLVVLCLFAYGNTFQNGFLLDDHALLLGEKTLGDVSFGTLFTEGFKTAYRPIAFSFLKLELSAFGEHPSGYHIVNLVLFTGACFLFYWILQLLTGNFTLSILPACLFAAHPINNFLINYKTAGCLIVYVLLMQAAFILSILYLKKKHIVYYWAVLVTYFICLFTHEITFVFPVYLLLLSYLLMRNGFLKSLMLCLPFAVPFGIFFAIRTHMVRSQLITSIFRLDLTPEQYVTLLSKLIFWYNTKIAVPHNIIFIWDEKIEGQHMTAGIIIGLIVVLGIWIISFLRGKDNLKAFAFNLYMAGFLPTALSSFTYTSKLKTAMIEPHWLVFPSIGLFLLTVLFLLDAQKLLKRNRIAIPIVAVLTIVLVLMTRTSNAMWVNDATYCKYWMNLNPLNGSAYACRSRAYIREHDRGPDMQHYATCEEIADLAGTYHHLGQNRISLQYYLAALKMDDHCVPAFYGLGTYYTDLEKYHMAEGAFQTMIALAPNKREAYEQLIRVYELEGKAKEAQDLREWLRQATEKAQKNK